MTTATAQLNERRQSLLEFIVGDYIQTAVPVASQQIAKRHRLRVSPATIRNDMAELEELGYISRPHASAGGVPADAAYRFYVERVAPRPRPSRRFEARVRSAIEPEAGDPEGWAREAAAVLSDAVLNVAIATTPRASHARIKQLQLVHLHDRHALLVLVMQEARLRRHIVPFTEPISQEELTALAARLNATLAGLSAAEVRRVWAVGRDDGGAADAVVAELTRLLDEEEREGLAHRYTEGLRHMLSQPEFQSAVSAREAVEVVEDDDMLRNVLSEQAGAGSVQVIIGGESHSQQLRPYSVVIARYGTPGQAMGVIGILGPTRMDYVRAISSVRYLADFLSGLVGALEEAP
ncbi:MAG: heat-inducible transcription repressor HrcA [Chloroflexi bacterium]|nr:heat-inducible transcription repressor HrcA [Chloroflexota bacterium]